MKLRNLRLLALLICCLPAVGFAKAPQSRDWEFRVWLDDKPIGTHRFSVREDESGQTVKSEADFEYRLLFVKLYEYTHANREVWKDNCLQEIQSETDANGKPYQVNGELTDNGFQVTGKDGKQELPPCVMTFAYWNPDFLKADRLLNAQNGEYLDVLVSEPVEESLQTAGGALPALRYRLKAGPLDLQLWYSPDHEWLALETEARNGRKLRYELL